MKVAKTAIMSYLLMDDTISLYTHLLRHDAVHFNARAYKGMTLLVSTHTCLQRLDNTSDCVYL
jgi:hypothetical protein